ncbi:MAG: hypothetical protein GX660_12505 [Clostridiaceae bacterium]|nr:hypothetical protein [Clostridiaceae bacterium]
MQLTKSKKINVGYILLWCILLGAGMIFLIFNNTHEGIWNDESYSVAYARLPINEFFSLVRYDSHPPLYYIMLKIFMLLFGKSLFALRTFSTLGIFAMGALGAGPVKKICGEKTGVIFSILVFITPASLTYGQEIRMYSWAAFFVTGSALYGYLSFTKPFKKNWLIYGLFTLAASFTHYYAMLAVIFINGFVALLVLSSKDMTKVKVFVLTTAAVVLCCIPLFFHLFSYVFTSGGVKWIPELTFEKVIEILASPYGSKAVIRQTALSVATYFCLVAIIIWGFINCIRKKEEHFLLPLISISAYLGTILFAVAYSIISKPAIVDRYTIPLLGLFLLTVAFMISRLKTSKAAVLCIAVLLASSPQLVNIEKSRFNGPVEEVVSYLKSNIGEDDCFIHTDVCTMGTLSYYFPQHEHLIYNKNAIMNIREKQFAPEVDVFWGSDLGIFSKDKSKVWVLDYKLSANNGILKEWVNEDRVKVIDTTKEFKLKESWLDVSITGVEVRE